MTCSQSFCHFTSTCYSRQSNKSFALDMASFMVSSSFTSFFRKVFVGQPAKVHAEKHSRAKQLKVNPSPSIVEDSKIRKTRER
jgi:hypothetical protein